MSFTPFLWCEVLWHCAEGTDTYRRTVCLFVFDVCYDYGGLTVCVVIYVQYELGHSGHSDLDSLGQTPGHHCLALQTCLCDRLLLSIIVSQCQRLSRVLDSWPERELLYWVDIVFVIQIWVIYSHRFFVYMARVWQKWSKADDVLPAVQTSVGNRCFCALHSLSFLVMGFPITGRTRNCLRLHLETGTSCFRHIRWLF